MEVEDAVRAVNDASSGSAGQTDLRQRRQAELRGLLQVSEGLVVISLPEDRKQTPHPLWKRIVSALEAGGETPEPRSIEDGFSIPTPGEIDGVGGQAIDHVAHPPSWDARRVAAIPKVTEEGLRMSDHFGLVVELECSPSP